MFGIKLPGIGFPNVATWVTLTTHVYPATRRLTVATGQTEPKLMRSFTIVLAAAALALTATACGGGGGSTGLASTIPGVPAAAGGGGGPIASSGPIPKHVLTMAYYGLDNAGLSASSMATYVDAVETAPGNPLGDAFVSAGGRFEVIYTDPNLVPFCSGTNCSGPLGNTTPEAAWLHSASGSRLSTSNSQDALDPMSSAMQIAFANYVNQYTSGTDVNAVLVDDMAPTYDPSYFQYKFGAGAAEFTTQAAWSAGTFAVIAASS